MKITHWVSALLIAASTPSWSIDVGQDAPEIELSGPAAKLSDLKGHVVYLDFWASWCGPCRESFPWMNEIQKKYAPQGLRVVGMNLDAKRADADKFLQEVPAQFTLAFDAAGASAKKIGVKGMPTSVLIDAKGKVLLVHQGFKRESHAELEAKIAAALIAPKP
jgi:cytochrome c biogenesis protein CcmG, thiol:disulfide interchange protein DsbE